MPPSSRSHSGSAATTALRKAQASLGLKGVSSDLREIPHWWDFGALWAPSRYWTILCFLEIAKSTHRVISFLVSHNVWQPAGCVSCELVCVCVSLVRVVIICLASTHTALVSSPSLAVLHLSTYLP